MAVTDDLECIGRQECSLIFPDFDEDVAWTLGCTLRSLATKHRYPIVIDVRRFDRALFFAAMPGSVPDNLEWVRRKSNVVQRYHRSSYAVGLELAAKNDTLEARYGLPLSDFAAHGGSFPIRIHSAGVIGSVTVSGMAQRDDHNLVVRALADVLNCGDEERGMSLFLGEQAE